MCSVILCVSSYLHLAHKWWRQHWFLSDEWFWISDFKCYVKEKEKNYHRRLHFGERRHSGNVKCCCHWMNVKKNRSHLHFCWLCIAGISHCLCCWMKFVWILSHLIDVSGGSIWGQLGWITCYLSFMLFVLYRGILQWVLHRFFN